MADSRSAAIDVRPPVRSGPAILAALGSVALGIGLLVYLADRARDPPALIHGLAGLAVGPLFGTLGQWLPSFVHPFAFSLFTAAASPRGARPAYGACIAWWAVNVAFEAGQHAALRLPLADIVHGVFGDTAMARGLAHYFNHGTFDMGDLVAATLGALAAAGVLRQLHRLEDRHGTAPS